jgi:lipopolysaccharide export LptBFGC system permease protein LptF
MRFTPSFYRLTALCSFASAVTTLGLIFLPGMLAPADDFAARMARVNDPVYRLYAWTYFVHPFLVVTAALAVAMRLRREAASLVIPGFLGFALWGATEAGQQAMTLFAFNRGGSHGSQTTRPCARRWNCVPRSTTARGTPCTSC